MDYNSNQSQGYIPKFSGPNHSYYMGDSGSLLGLMQTGGNISPAYKRSFGLNRTAGGAKFAQAQIDCWFLKLPYDFSVKSQTSQWCHRRRPVVRLRLELLCRLLQHC